MRWTVTLAFAIFLARPGLAAPLEQMWTAALPAAADGITALDSDGDGALEVAIVGSAGLSLIDNHGVQRWMFETGNQFMGTPAAKDLDGDGADEIVACEFGASASCFAVDGDGTALWSSGPFYYPTLWNMGPKVADIDGDLSLEVVLATWGGQLISLDGATGSIEWTYDAYTDIDELFYGPATVGNLDGDAALEVVAFGYRHGRVAIVDGATGLLQMASDPLRTLYGDYAVGTGATLVDVNGDSQLDVVLASYGTDSAVYAMDASGSLLWRTALTAKTWWVSPQVGDTDNDGAPEIVVASADASVFQLELDGTISQSYSVGTDSWFEPVLVDVNSDLVPDIVSASWDTIDVSKGSGDSLFSHVDAAGQFWRAVVEDIDRDGFMEIVVSDWPNNRVIAFEFPAAEVLSLSLHTLTLTVQEMATDPALSEDAVDELGKVVNELEQGSEKAIARKLVDSFNEAKSAIEHLGHAQDDGADVVAIRQSILDTLFAAVGRCRERVIAITSSTAPQVVEGDLWVSSAYANIAAGDWKRAVEDLIEAVKALNDGLGYLTSNCPAVPSHAILANQCIIIDVRDRTMALAQSPTNPSAIGKLEDAASEMEHAAEKLVASARKDAADKAEHASKKLDDAIAEGADLAAVTALQVDLTQAIAAEANQAVVEAEIVLGAGHSDVIEAQIRLAEAEVATSTGNYTYALERYKKALEKVE